VSDTSEETGFDSAAAITRSLLGWGVVAGIFYLMVGIVLALTRDGFDITRHALSLLMLGDLGWIQTLNLILSGIMTIAAAVGFARVMRWPGLAGVLIGAYGACLIGSGIFPPDPMAGFPDGAVPGEASTSGILHLAFGGIGFLLLGAASLVFAAYCRRRRESGWAAYSWISGAVVIGGFVGGAALSTQAIGIGLLWIAVVAGWSWLAAASIHLYRAVPHPDLHRRIAAAAG
jgi:hypothetical protein